MPRRPYWTSAAALILASVSAQARFQDDAALGRVRQCSGKVILSGRTSRHGDQAVRSGQPVEPGSLFKTGHKGSLSLGLDNGCELRFLPGSEARVNWDDEELGGALVTLYAGTLRAAGDLKGGRILTVDSGTLLARAEKARWQLQCGPRWSKLSVWSGSVRVRVAGTHEDLVVPKGHKALASFGNSRTQPLTQGELKTLSEAFQALPAPD